MSASGAHDGTGNPSHSTFARDREMNDAEGACATFDLVQKTTWLMNDSLFSGSILFYGSIADTGDDIPGIGQYEDFHTIDWQRDIARDRMRHRYIVKKVQDSLWDFIKVYFDAIASLCSY